MNNSVTLYGDLMSQPTRAILFFLINNKIDHQLKLVSIAKLEQRSDEFAKLNPFKKLPVIQHNNKTIYESHTILRYLAQTFKLESLYSSSSLDDRVKVDTYLDWHHLGLRKQASSLFFQKFILPNFGKEPSKDIVKDAEFNLPLSLKQVEQIFLKNGQNQYLIGDKITIADYSCYCEIKQLEMLKYDLSQFKVLNEWMKRMELLDGCTQANKILNRIVSKL